MITIRRKILLRYGSKEVDLCFTHAVVAATAGHIVFEVPNGFTHAINLTKRYSCDVCAGQVTQEQIDRDTH